MWLREAAACLTNNPWVLGGTVKPALTQPWGLRDVPEHLIWAVWWPLESFTNRLVNTRGVLEYIPSYFVYVTYVCSLIFASKMNMLLVYSTNYSQALLILFPIRFTSRFATILAPLCALLKPDVCGEKKIPNDMLTFHKMKFFHQVAFSQVEPGICRDRSHI